MRNLRKISRALENVSYLRQPELDLNMDSQVFYTRRSGAITFMGRLHFYEILSEGHLRCVGLRPLCFVYGLVW